MTEPQLPETMDLETRIKFFRAYNPLVTLFGEELVNEGLLKYEIRDLCIIRKAVIREEFKQPRGRSPSPLTNEVDLGTAWTYTEIPHPRDNGYSKHGKALCAFFLGPNPYQGLKHAGLIIRPALLKLFPFLANYKLDVYEYRGHPEHQEEFYVNLDRPLGINGWCTSIYVPYKMLLNRDVEGIIAHNKDVLEKYAVGIHDEEAVNWEVIKHDERVKQFLEDLK